MNKDNFYVAFSMDVTDTKVPMEERYGDLHVYWKDTGRMESLFHITYNQLCETYRYYNIDGNRDNISLIPSTIDGDYACPWINSFLWNHMDDILDSLKIYICEHYGVVATQTNEDYGLVSYIDYLGNTIDGCIKSCIRRHHSLVFRESDRCVYIGGLTATQLYDNCVKYKKMSSEDDYKKYAKPFATFIALAMRGMQYWKSMSISMIGETVWNYYCQHVDRSGVAHDILSQNNDRSLSHDILRKEYDDNPCVFKDNINALVDEVNHKYDSLYTKLNTLGFEPKDNTTDEKPSEMDELMSTFEYLRKNIAVSFVKMPETRGDYKITLCNINDPSGIIYKCPDEITVKSVRENLKPESKGSRFYKLFSTVKDMYTDLKCEYIPATDIMGYISSEYNRTVRCSAQLPVATRQIKSDLFKMVLNAFPVTYNGKDDLEFTITLYHMNTGVVYIIILPGQLFTASQVLEYTKSLQDYRDMIHDPIRSQKTKIFETRILDLLRTASEDFNMTDVMELIYGAYAISVNHRIKNW